jgi:penicillin-insensitive murein endopeptidase
MKHHRIKLIVLSIPLIGLFIKSTPNIFYYNSGQSTSVGTSANGSLKGAYQVKYKTNNSTYFSPISYYFMGNGYVNSRLYNTILDSYAECEKTCQGIDFKIMECSDNEGGKILLHRTHRSGMSIDFMVPLLKNGKQTTFYDNLGLWHYLLNFDSTGKLNIDKKVSVDFETIGKHIIALDNAARANGLVISIVILKIDLKDDFFNTASGKEVKRRGIYFAKNLPDHVNVMHDDHYHVDFQLKKSLTTQVYKK